MTRAKIRNTLGRVNSSTYLAPARTESKTCKQQWGKPTIWLAPLGCYPVEDSGMSREGYFFRPSFLAMSAGIASLCNTMFMVRPLT